MLHFDPEQPVNKKHPQMRVAASTQNRFFIIVCILTLISFC